MANAKDLYAKAQAALEAGNTREGRRLLQQALREDRDYLDAWVALAKTQQGVQQERSFNEILRLDPKNAYVQQTRAAAKANETTLDDLFGRGQEDDAPPPREDPVAPPSETTAVVRSNRPLETRADELVPGVKRRWAVIAALILPVYTIVIGAFAVFLVSSNQSERAALATQSAQIIATQTSARVTEVAFQNQQTATQEMINTMQTGEAVAQLTAERAITLTAFQEQGSTATPTELIQFTPTRSFSGEPPPDTLRGRIFAWGGFSATSEIFLPLRVYNPAAQDAFAVLGQEFGTHPRVDRAASRLIFTSRDILVDETAIARFNPNNPSEISDTFGGELLDNILDNQRLPYLTLNGDAFAFLADDARTGGTEIQRYDLGSQRLLPITRDAIPYESVALSANASQLYAVKADATGTDIVLIDLPSVEEVAAAASEIEFEDREYLQVRLTFDGDQLVERDLYLSPDDSRLVFSAYAQGDPDNADIYIFDVSSDATTTPQPLIQTEADEIYPVFSPDGQYVAYASNVNGQYNIFIYDLANDVSYQMTDELNNPVFPGSWSN